VSGPSKSGKQEGLHEAWRPTIEAILAAFAEGDFTLSRGIADVEPDGDRVAQQRRFFVSSYGETLAPLSDTAWKTSVSIWMREHWDLLVDLSTVESGRSDMVVDVQVTEREGGFRYKVGIIYVP
jgi:hypothetical protein